MRRRNGHLLLSDSMLEVHRHCSAKFWFNYLEKPIVEPRIPPFEFGSLIHKMFEDFFKRSKRPDAKMYTSAEHFARVFVGKWMGIDHVSQNPDAKSAKRAPLVFSNREYADPITGKIKRSNEKSEYMWKGKAICKRFFEENINVPPSHVLLEHHFELELEPDPVSGSIWVLQGYIDRLELRDSTAPAVWDYTPENIGSAIRSATDGVLYCIDYKTGRHAPAPEALRGDTQFSTYDLAIEQLFPNIPQRRFAIHAVEDDWKFIETPRSAVDRTELMKRISEQARMIETEQYRFLGDMYACARCPFVLPCGELRNWADKQQTDPETIMRREAPFALGRSKKLITWQNGRLVAVKSDELLGDETVFGYGRHTEMLEEGLVPLSFDPTPPAQAEAPVVPAVASKRKPKKAPEQISLLG